MKKTPAKIKRADRPIATIDFETDPFKYGRIPAPFCAGFYSLDIGFKCFWGADCVDMLCDFIDTLETPHLIYAHNGGKFDYHFMLDRLENPIKVIGNRIALVNMGIHELRDSYSILPVPLAAYVKDSIDYKKLEANRRDKHKAEIVSYLKTDCVALHELVTKFILTYGIKLTIGAAAIKELIKHHPFDHTNKSHDALFREFYFGGRVEAMQTGAMGGNWKIYDVNSMYPFVMKQCDHPTGTKYISIRNPKLDKKGNLIGHSNAPFYFAKIRCKQSAAFPVRVKGQPLNFDLTHGEFSVTSHELKAAIETNRVSDVEVLIAFIPEQTIKFDRFVDIGIKAKIDAKKAHLSADNVEDKNRFKANELLAKLILNSSYGKFGSDVENYYDYWLGDCDDASYDIYSVGIDTIEIWRKPSNSTFYYDVATAASITGAARAVLMRAISNAVKPIYCDTDSLICESLNEALDETALGAWKLEGVGDMAYVAGKKMYAVSNHGEFVKVASKGVRVGGNDIVKICEGKDIYWENDAPSFSIKKETTFVKRKIKGKKPF